MSPPLHTPHPPIPRSRSQESSRENRHRYVGKKEKKNLSGNVKVLRAKNCQRRGTRVDPEGILGHFLRTQFSQLQSGIIIALTA
jgi:hypothetical protein